MIVGKIHMFDLFLSVVYVYDIYYDEGMYLWINDVFMCDFIGSILLTNYN